MAETYGGILRSAMKPSKPPKQKKGRNRKCALKSCKTFSRTGVIHNNQYFCDNDCAAVQCLLNLRNIQAKQQQKALRDQKAAKQVKDREFRQRKRALNETDIKWQKNQTKRAVHDLVKLLDSREACIVCQGFECGQRTEWDAGHYLTKAAHPELKFDPRNIFKQCSGTNTASTGRKAGEATIRQKFEQGIIARYGMAHLLWLKSYHAPKKWTCQELAAIRTEALADCRRLKKGEPPSRDWRALPITNHPGEPP